MGLVTLESGQGAGPLGAFVVLPEHACVTLRDSDDVVIVDGDLAGETGTVETWEIINGRRLYWVTLTGESTPVPFLQSQLRRWDEIEHIDQPDEATAAA